ncbi:MAG TPA: phosphotransferase [Nitrospirales bacterium]|nr:phosphotransferase [Nitrospirales bacterium]
MGLIPANTFQYIQLERESRRYLCLQQNFFVLFWILFFKKDTIRTKIRPESKLNLFKFYIDTFPTGDLLPFFKNNSVTLLKFLAYKFELRKSKSMVCLPVFGHTCVQVHQGYKIFDLRRGVVIKLFNPDVSYRDISNEIDQLKNVSRLNFAPSLRKMDPLKRWYEEDYFVGSVEASRVPRDSDVLFQNFQELVPHLINLILLQTPFVKNTDQYVGDLIRSLEATRIGRPSSTTNGDFIKIQNFVHSIVDSLKSEGSVPLYHVFTHGDFCPENILKTRYGLKVFDWEGAKNRTALFDFYSYFFYRPTKRIPVKNLVCEINKSLPYFISKLSEGLPELARSISDGESLYRKLYYLERISMLAEREMTDKRLNIRDHIFQYIDDFENYEQRLPVVLPS